MTTVIALVGKRRSGKDTVAEVLMSEVPGAVRMNFSDPIIAELEAQVGMAITDENKWQYREQLQELGRRRRAEDPGYRTRRVTIRALRAVREGAPLLIICGAREASDLEAVRELGARVVLVRRSGFETGGVPPIAYSALRRLPLRLHRLLPRSWRAGLHPNEVAIDNVQPDEVIENVQSLAYLTLQARALVDRDALSERIPSVR